MRQKKETTYYTINGKGEKIPYQMNKAEEMEYLTIIDLMGIWGGIPCDVGWARSTNSYQEVKKYIVLRNPNIEKVI